MTIFAVDGNYALHRIFHTGKDSTSETIARRFVSLVCKDALAVKADRVLVAFDGNRVFRYKIYDGYKGTRSKDKGGDIADDGPYVHLSKVQEYLGECGIPNVQHSIYEADDVLASVAENNANVVLGARDKDTFQVLRKDVKMYDSAFKVNNQPAPRYITASDVQKHMGISKDKCLDLQTLIGDGIDNVPMLVKKSTAIKGLNQHGSIKQWMANDPEFRRLMSKRKHELILNRKLVKLVTDIDVEIPAIRWNKHKDMTLAYIKYREFCNPKSKGLFAK